MPADRKRKVESLEEDDDVVIDDGASSSAGAKKQKSSALGTWTQVGDGLLVFDHKDIKPSRKIAAFDFDGTLVTPKSGRAHPTGPSDWRVWDVNEQRQIDKLNSLYQQGYKLVIFTNQKGVKKGHMTVDGLRSRLEAFVARAAVPFQIFAALGDDHFRKPAIGMWEYLQEHKNSGFQIDLESSLFVGDAAGRPKAWDGGPKTKKDHSAADRKFALNVGFGEFHTPEEYFLGKAKYDVSKCLMGFDPSSIQTPATPMVDKRRLLPAVKQLEVVVMVGFPASGKSSIAKRIFVAEGYVYVNRDSLGTPAKCFALARQSLSEGKSCVVDNTNPDVASRADYIAIAEEYSAKVRCVYVSTSRELAGHLNYMREAMSKGERAHVPGVAYNMYKKKFTVPKADEGFDQVITVDFEPVFSNEDERKAFYRRYESD